MLPGDRIISLSPGFAGVSVFERGFFGASEGFMGFFGPLRVQGGFRV